MQRIALSRRYLPALVLGALALLVALVLAWQTGAISGLFSSGEVPSFTLQDRAGRIVSSAMLRGRPALVHFWASWCAPCLQELPAWLKKVDQSKGSQLQFVAISLDAKWVDADTVLSKASLPSNLVLLIDPEQKASDAFGSFQFPETYLVAADGRVVRKWVGAQDWAAMDFVKLVAETQGGAKQ